MGEILPKNLLFLSGLAGLGLAGSGRVGWLDNLEIRLNSAQLELSLAINKHWCSNLLVQKNCRAEHLTV